MKTENIMILLKNFINKIIKYLEFYSEHIPFNNAAEIAIPKRKRILLWAVFLFIIIAFLWADFAKIDEVTRGEGKVIPSSQVQVIQNLEGGIISKINVKEGQIVNKDQILMELDKTRFLSSFEESKVKSVSLHLQILRLKAEISEKPFNIPNNYQKSYYEQAQHQNELYENRQKEKAQLNESYQLAVKELKINEPLVKKGAVSPTEIIRLQRAASEIKEQLLKFNSDALKDLNEARAQYEVLKQSMLADQDRLNRTTIRSPVRGIVKVIKINTVGGVSQPGSELMEIVPLDDSLLIEAKILPKDIGFIHPGLNARVKIAAFDFSIYGGLDGTVEQVSADAIQEEKAQDKTFYLIRVRTQQNYLGTHEKPLYIIPGMTATVEILTGKKTVLHYLLKPLLKTKENALTER